MKLNWLSKNEIKIFIFGFIGGLIARGITLFSFGHSIDDYVYMSSPIDNHFVIGQGRWGTVLINELFISLGIRSAFTITLFFFLSLLVMSFVGIIICRIWKIKDNFFLSLLIILIFITFPYQAEIYTFKTANIFFTIPILTSTLSLYLSKYKIKNILISIILLIFSLSIYQVVLSYILLIFIFSILIIYLRHSNMSFFSRIKDIFHEKEVLARIITLISGLTIYLFLNKIILKIFKIQISDRGQFINIFNKLELIKRFHEIRILLIKTYFENEPIFPTSLKVMLLFLLILSLILISKFLINKKNKKESLLNIIILILVVNILLIFFIVPIIPLASWWPVPRVIASISIFWCGIITILYKKTKNKIIHSTIFIIGSCLVFCFLAINNNIYIDQIRVNQKDINKANRIISRLEINENFNKINYISIVGLEYGYGSQISTLIGDLNMSAFGAEWAKIPLLNEISGYNFLPPSTEQYSEAINYCKNSKKWPSEESVTIHGTNGIICLNNNF